MILYKNQSIVTHSTTKVPLILCQMLQKDFHHPPFLTFSPNFRETIRFPSMFDDNCNDNHQQQKHRHQRHQQSQGQQSQNNHTLDSNVKSQIYFEYFIWAARVCEVAC